MKAAAGNRIAIVGAGPVGLACALALSTLRNVDVTLIERQTLALAPVSSQFDHRVYAISPGSKRLLESIDVWARIDAKRIEPIREMQVFGDTPRDSGSSELDLSHGTPLAYVVEHATLMNALQETLKTRTNIALADGASVASIAMTGATRSLVLSDGRTFPAELVIAADGANSRLREMVQLSATQKDYESDGVVANFYVEKPHLSVARQWFSADGVLAYLPLPDTQMPQMRHQMSIVFSVAKKYADELMQLSEAEFSATISAAGHESLGALTLASERAQFPLKRVMAENWVAPGFALIGDAAHAIHPLAGQGANLGFADVAALVETLSTRSALSGIGDLALLRRYERARREDALAMGEITDGLRSLYLNPSSWARRARNQGLDLLNKLPMAKATLVGHVVR
jgi:2-polyprenylphenol 6-hydroxylase